MKPISDHFLEKPAYQIEALDPLARDLIVSNAYSRGMEVYSNQKWLVIFLPFGGGMGLTLGSHVFLRGEIDSKILAHEAIHFWQFKKYGIFGFFLRYLYGLFLLLR